MLGFLFEAMHTVPVEVFRFCVHILPSQPPQGAVHGVGAKRSSCFSRDPDSFSQSESEFAWVRLLKLFEGLAVPRPLSSGPAGKRRGAPSATPCGDGTGLHAHDPA